MIMKMDVKEYEELMEFRENQIGKEDNEEM